MKNLNLSFYTVPVKLTNDSGKYLLIHGYTGAVDVVSASLWDKLKCCPSKIELSDELLKSLEDRGYLTEKSKEEELAYVDYIANVLSKRNHKLFKKDFTLVVTYDCNFRCPYYYEKIDDYDVEFDKKTLVA